MKTQDGRTLTLVKDNLTIKEAQEYLEEVLRKDGHLNRVSEKDLENMGLQLFREIKRYMDRVRHFKTVLDREGGENVVLEHTLEFLECPQVKTSGNDDISY